MRSRTALVVRRPQSGGEYLSLARDVHPFAGFLAGVVSFTAGFTGPIALAALTCEQYLPVPLPSWVPERTVATAVVLACGAAHATVGRFATRAGTVIVAMKMVVILALVAVGEFVIAGRPPVAAAAITAPSAGAFAATVTWIMFSYIGFNQAVYVAAEAVDPVRTVPRALVVGTLATTAAYLLLNDVFLRSASRMTCSQVGPTWHRGPPSPSPGRPSTRLCGRSSRSRRSRPWRA